MGLCLYMCKFMKKYLEFVQPIRQCQQVLYRIGLKVLQWFCNLYWAGLDQVRLSRLQAHICSEHAKVCYLKIKQIFIKIFITMPFLVLPMLVLHFGLQQCRRFIQFLVELKPVYFNKYYFWLIIIFVRFYNISQYFPSLVLQS